jgi:MFS family permease
VLALAYFFVRDYRTVELTPKLDHASRSAGGVLAHIGATLARSRTLRWVCIGAAGQLVVVSTIFAWLPSYLNRFHGLAPDQAGKSAALVVLCAALGSVVCGAIVDRAGRRRPRAKMHAVAGLCVATMLVLLVAFGAGPAGHAITPAARYGLIALGAFLMTCSVGPAAAFVIDVVHPGVRSTGASVLSLFQNLFGLAAGPFISGALSDAFGLERALALMPLFGLIALAAFLRAARSYESELRLAAEAPPGAAPNGAPQLRNAAA